MYVCMYVCARACMHVGMRVCVRARVYVLACAFVHAYYVIDFAGRKRFEFVIF
jgi:hypothetical protein